MRALIFKIEPNSLKLIDVNDYTTKTLNHLTYVAGKCNIDWNPINGNIVFTELVNKSGASLFQFLNTLAFNYDIELL